MILRFWSLHPHLEDDWLEGCPVQEDYSIDDYDDEDSSFQVCATDDVQDGCSDVADLGATDSTNLCSDLSASATCFAVPVSNRFSTLAVEDVPPETPDSVDSVPSPQLQRSKRGKTRGRAALVDVYAICPEVCQEAIHSPLPVESVSSPFALHSPRASGHNPLQSIQPSHLRTDPMNTLPVLPSFHPFPAHFHPNHDHQQAEFNYVSPFPFCNNSVSATSCPPYFFWADMT